MTRRPAGQAALVLALLTVTGCALPQAPIPKPDGTVLQVTTDPLQYRSALPRDVRWGATPPREAYGESCSTLLSFPPSPPTVFPGSGFVAQAIPYSPLMVRAGNDGYAKAVARAEKSVGGGPLFDVRADLHTTSVLGFLTFACVEVHALAAR